MFVRYYMELPLPARQVEHAMFDAPAEWLSTVAGEAQRRGDHLLTEVGVGPLGPRLGRRVTIQVGEPVRFPSMTTLPLTWEPLGLDGVLPRLEADIELGSLGEDRTQLAISARYRPPLGALGRTVDRVLLHRVAEATVKDFLDRVGAAITSQAGADADGPVSDDQGGRNRDAPRGDDAGPLEPAR
jgi:hypothetical protein